MYISFSRRLHGNRCCLWAKPFHVVARFLPCLQLLPVTWWTLLIRFCHSSCFVNCLLVTRHHSTNCMTMSTLKPMSTLKRVILQRQLLSSFYSATPVFLGNTVSFILSSWSLIYWDESMLSSLFSLNTEEQVSITMRPAWRSGSRLFETIWCAFRVLWFIDVVGNVDLVVMQAFAVGIIPTCRLLWVPVHLVITSSTRCFLALTLSLMSSSGRNQYPHSLILPILVRDRSDLGLSLWFLFFHIRTIPYCPFPKQRNLLSINILLRPLAFETTVLQSSTFEGWTLTFQAFTFELPHWP